MCERTRLLPVLIESQDGVKGIGQVIVIGKDGEDAPGHFHPNLIGQGLTDLVREYEPKKGGCQQPC